MDLFLGSGSTLIAAERTGRTCYGLELDPHYCSMVMVRWEGFTGKNAQKWIDVYCWTGRRRNTVKTSRLPREGQAKPQAHTMRRMVAPQEMRPRRSPDFRKPPEVCRFEPPLFSGQSVQQS